MNLNLEPPTEASVVRVKVACINWGGHPYQLGAPKAVMYVLRDGEMVADRYYATWREAMDRALNTAALYGLRAGR